MGYSRCLSPCYVFTHSDLNDSLCQDTDEPAFTRHRLHCGHVERIGLEDQAEIRCIAVRGDTPSGEHELPLDPCDQSIDENPGCIALVIQLGEFEFYTAGDQTDEKWQHEEEPVAQKILASGAAPGGNDVDVLKVSHHGSDSSSSPDFVDALDPEVAIISTKFTAGDKLPKKNALRQFQKDHCYTLITGDGLKPSADFQDSPQTAMGDPRDFWMAPDAVFQAQRDLTGLASADWGRHTVVGRKLGSTFSVADGENGWQARRFGHQTGDNLSAARL